MRFNSKLTSKSFDFIETPNGHVKKYKNGYFEAMARTSVQNEFTFTQLGNTNIWFAPFTNFGFGITAKEVESIQINAYNTGVVWAGNASLNTNKLSVDGNVFQYGSDKTRITTVMVEVKGWWK